MSSQQLCGLIAELGIQNASDVSPDSLTWACQHEGSRSIVKWICANIGKENVLSQKEMEEYEALKKKNIVLEGEELDKAFKRIIQGSEEEEEELESVVQDTFEEIQDLKDRKENLTNILDRLLEQKQMMEKQLSHVDIPIAAMKDDVEELEPVLTGIKANADKQNESIISNLTKLEQALADAENFSCGTVPGKPPELVSLKLQPFYDSCEHHLESLLQSHKMEFDVDIIRDSEAAASHPDDSFVSSYTLRSKELERLCKVQGKAEEQKAVAFAELARQEAELEYQLSFNQSEGRAAVEYEPILRARLKSEAKVKSLLEKENETLRSELAGICAGIADLARADILKSHFESVESRLTEFLHRYDKFSVSLVDHLSLHLVLLEESDRERKAFLDMFAAMAAVHAELLAIVRCNQRRNEAMKRAVEGRRGSDGFEEQATEILSSGADSKTTAELFLAKTAAQKQSLEELLFRDTRQTSAAMSVSLAESYKLLCSEGGHVEILPRGLFGQMERLTKLVSDMERALGALASNQGNEGM